MGPVVGRKHTLGIVLEIELAAIGAEVVGVAGMLGGVLGAVDDDLHATHGIDGNAGTGGSGLIIHASESTAKPRILSHAYPADVTDRPTHPPSRLTDDRKLLTQRPFADPSFLESDAWRALRIMGEFIDGFDALARLGPAVTIFGSARTKPDHPMYAQARALAVRLSDEGFTVITGGGPGIMEAANRGAKEADGVSVGLAIDLPHETGLNRYVDLAAYFRYFFVRKTMFVKYAQAFVIFPGGFGTFDELFESLTLVQTGKIDHFPIILFGSEYWSGLLDWLRATVVREANVYDDDLELIRISDDVEEIVDIIAASYRERDENGASDMPGAASD
jgi:uncharacterized protein (TIGR00730 family)